MALTRPAFDVNNVQGLGDLVQNQATAVKVIFDKTGTDAKAYLASMCTDIETQFVSNTELDAVIAGQINTIDPITGFGYAIIISNGLLGVRRVT